MLVKITLPVIPKTKKNSMQKTKHGLIQSAAYRQYESDCLMLMPCGWRNAKLSAPCNVKCVYFMPDRRRVDLLNLLSATLDILVKSGVLADDHSGIVRGHDGSTVLIDKANPRTEIEIDLMEETK